MGEADDKMLKAIKHYQESLERHTKTGKSEKLLHAIGKLALLPIRVWHLEETGVGRTVNGLKKIEGAVGEHARNLVDKWKFMVKGEEEKHEGLEYEHISIKQEKVDAEPGKEPLQISTNQANGDNDKHSFKTNAFAHSRSRSPTSNNRSSRESKTNSSHSTKRHHSKNSPSYSEVASKRHKPTKSESKSKNSNYSDTNSESESDNESDSSKQSESESRSAHSTSGSSDNSSSGSSESSSSDEEDCDKTESRRKRHSSNESCSDDYRRKKSINLSTSKKSSREDSVNDRKTKEYPKTHDSKKKHKNSQSDSSDEGDKDLKYKAKKQKDTKISGSKNDDKYNRHHNSKSVLNKSRHSTEKSIESKLNSTSDSSKYKNSKLTDSESVNRAQEKPKDRDSHRSSNKRSKSDDSRKDDSREEKSHKGKKDEKSETIRKRTRDASASRESKKCKTDTDSKDSGRSHHHSSTRKSQENAREKTSDMSKAEKSSHRSKAKNETRDPSRDKSSNSSDSKANKVPKKLVDGIDSGSGTSFADVLGMLEAPVYSKSKKKSTAIDETIVYSPKKTSSASKEDKCVKGTKQAADSMSSFKTKEEVPTLLQDPVGLEPLDINISSLLPSITPNYRPLGVTLDANKKIYMDEEAFSRVISAKHQRTKVYSGNKVTYTKVPTLFDLCSRILQDNLDALEYTGGVPYSILKPILEKANPNQLYQLEFHNPYLIEDTDELWQLHCQKEFRNKKREELESWREMYLRCLDEREAKLKALTANIKQSQDKSLPVRQTKLAYVDSVVKPPRNIARKQMKNGTAIEIKKPSQTPTDRLNQLARSGEAAKIAVPNPSRSTVERSSSHSSHIKPKKAPLMAKTLSLLKNRFGRR